MAKRKNFFPSEKVKRHRIVAEGERQLAGLSTKAEIAAAKKHPMPFTEKQMRGFRKIAQAGSNFIRDRLREVFFARKLLPPEQVTS